MATLVQKTLEAKGEELAKEEAETEKEADEALRREESVVAERRGAVEGAADEVAALAPKVPRRRPCVASTAWGVTRRRRDRRVDGVPSPRRLDTRCSAQVAEAERIQREADDQLRKLRNATDASLAQAKKKVDDQNKRLDDFRCRERCADS